MQVGQSVKVINDKPLSESGIKPPLKMDEVRKIQILTNCSCGELHVDVGLNSTYNYITCFKCGEELPRGNNIHWAHSSRFEVVQS